MSEVKQVPQGRAKKYEFFRMGNKDIEKYRNKKHRKKLIYFGKGMGNVLKQYSGWNSYRNAIIPFVLRGVNPDLDSQQLDLESKMRIRQDDLSERN